MVPPDPKTRTPILTNRFRLPGQRFMRARARLFRDCIELDAWGWSGRRFRRRVPLERVRHVEWWTGAKDCNLELRLEGGERLGLWVHGAAQWKFAIEAQRTDGAKPSWYARIAVA